MAFGEVSYCRLTPAAVVTLYPHQRKAIDKLRSGSILCGGVGTGKSITSLGYFWKNELFGGISEDGRLGVPLARVPLYIITTARKRDTGEWEKELNRYGLSTNRAESVNGIPVVIDSWNNIGKYASVTDAFFIFDEQRVVGHGVWVKAFLKLARSNRWILLTATPGDSWMDYIPVFLANGFYKNRSQFLREHAVFSMYTKYPRVEKWLDTTKLETLRRHITVLMEFEKQTVPHYVDLSVSFDEEAYRKVVKDRWDIWNEKPIQEAGGLCYAMRRVVNSDPSRLDTVRSLLNSHDRAIIFYNFDYELEELRTLSDRIHVAEWNGHKHEKIPHTKKWAYLVQYTAGSEGWNCVDTDTVIFYSQNYSYKVMTQAAGRIDRLNTKFKDLFYYTLKSDSSIDRAIANAIRSKHNFNEKIFEEAITK